LSHSSKDKEVVREIAERLREDGLRVWFDEREIKPHSTKAFREKKTEEGLEHSRVLVLCLSQHAVGADWPQLEAGTFRFRDPLNKERRFIPLRLDEVPIKGALAHFSYIYWLTKGPRREYAKLLGSCRPSSGRRVVRSKAAPKHSAESMIQLDSGANIFSLNFNSDGSRAVTISNNSIVLWDLKTGLGIKTIRIFGRTLYGLAWSQATGQVLSSDSGGSIRLWDLQGGQELAGTDFENGSRWAWGVAWDNDRNRALAGFERGEVIVWYATGGWYVLGGHTDGVTSVAFSADGQCAVSGSLDKTVRIWDLPSRRCLRVFEGHTDSVLCVAFSADRHRAISGSNDKTLCIWDLESGHCLQVLEGHAGGVISVVWSLDGRRVLSGADDNTVRLWDANTGRCLSELEGHSADVQSVAWTSDQHHAISGDRSGAILVWDLAKFVNEIASLPRPGRAPKSALAQALYTNAKVLLVGDSGAGKTGLSNRLALNDWQPSDSTVGAWATQWKLPVSSKEGGSDGVEREIWLWDFGGQADQRLIHQLYMDETALAVLVFDGQKEDVFETLGQWDRDLARASRKTFSKLLVAGRVDAGGLRVSRTQLETFRCERGYHALLETSAKANLGCEELKQAILSGIRWDEIPWRSSPLLFKQLKEEIIRLKDAGRALIRFNELRETLQLQLLAAKSGEPSRFTDDELKAVVSLLTGPGVVWELKFGSWVLLQPERVNAYAQAVIQTLRGDEFERGCIPEERVLRGALAYQSSMKRLAAEEERFVLLAMHQTLVERGLCLREHTDKGPMLIFPSFYRRERPELVGHPAVHVSYRFNGFLDEIYATLVVRLHHTQPFKQDQLWRYAADFKTLTERQLGVKMERRVEGAGELVVYADPAIPDAEKIIFSRYVHEHILQKGRDMVRLRHYCCPHCNTPVGNREVAI